MSAQESLRLANAAPSPLQAQVVALPEPPTDRLEDVLIARKLVPLELIDTARKVQDASGARLGAILVISGKLSERAREVVLAHRLNVPRISLDSLPGDDNAQQLVSAAFADERESVPFLYSVTKRTLKVAFAEPTEARVLDYAMKFEVQVEPYLATRDEIKRYAYFLYNWNMYKRTDLAHSDASGTKMYLGDTLVSLELISGRELSDALKVQAATGLRLGTVLLRSGRLSEEARQIVLNEPMKAPMISLTAARADTEATAKISLQLSEDGKCVPFLFTDGTLSVAFEVGPTERQLLDLEVQCGSHIKPFAATARDIELFRYVLYDNVQRPTSDAREAFKVAQESRQPPRATPPPSTPDSKPKPKPERQSRQRPRRGGKYAHL